MRLYHLHAAGLHANADMNHVSIYQLHLKLDNAPHLFFHSLYLMVKNNTHKSTT